MPFDVAVKDISFDSDELCFENKGTKGETHVD